MQKASSTAAIFCTQLWRRSDIFCIIFGSKHILDNAAAEVKTFCSILQGCDSSFYFRLRQKGKCGIFCIIFKGSNEHDQQNVPKLDPTRVGQSQRILRSSWSVPTAISIELVSFNGYIGRVGQFQRLYRSSWSAFTDTSCVRPITRSIDRAGGGKDEQSYTTQNHLMFYLSFYSTARYTQR